MFLSVVLPVITVSHGKVDRELLRIEKIKNVNKRCKDAVLRISLLSAEIV